jgi:hypothetical protein
MFWGGDFIKISIFWAGAPEGVLFIEPSIPSGCGVVCERLTSSTQKLLDSKTVRFCGKGFLVEPSIPSGWGSTRN